MLKYMCTAPNHLLRAWVPNGEKEEIIRKKSKKQALREKKDRKARLAKNSSNQEVPMKITVG